MAMASAVSMKRKKKNRIERGKKEKVGLPHLLLLNFSINTARKMKQRKKKELIC